MLPPNPRSVIAAKLTAMGWSERDLAARMRKSNVTISSVMRGAEPMPETWIPVLRRLLDLDDGEVQQLRDLCLLSHVPKRYRARLRECVEASYRHDERIARAEQALQDVQRAVRDLRGEP